MLTLWRFEWTWGIGSPIKIPCWDLFLWASWWSLRQWSRISFGVHTEVIKPQKAAAFLLLAAAFATVVAVCFPYLVGAWGIVLLGPAHVFLASRYMAGRIAGTVSQKIALTLVVAVLVMMLVRAVAIISPTLGRYLELFGSLAIIAWALLLGLRGKMKAWALLPLLLIAFMGTFDLPANWYLLVHAHNVVPLIFLWDWARGRSAGVRLGFIGANLVWAVGIPAAIVSGLFDDLLRTSVPEGFGSIDFHSLAHGLAPSNADPIVTTRALCVFVFLQLMHYVLWMVFFQVAGRDQITKVPMLTTWKFWAATVGVSAVVWLSYFAGYGNGRAVYSVLGALNVFLEQPIGAWLLLTALPVAATTPLVQRLRAI